MNGERVREKCVCFEIVLRVSMNNVCMFRVASNVRIRTKVAHQHFVLPTYIILANNQRPIDRIDHSIRLNRRMCAGMCVCTNVKQEKNIRTLARSFNAANSVLFSLK